MQESKKETVEEDHTCSICLDVFFKPVILPRCGHHFCENCLYESAMLTEARRCPLCRTGFSEHEVRSQTDFWASLQKAYPQSLKQKQSHITERVMMSLLIGNTTRVINTNQDNKYEWQLYVKSPNGQDTLAKYAESIEVHLHETFHPNKIVFQVKGNQGVKVKRVGWGTFRIAIGVRWKGGFTEKASNFHHDLEFQPVHQKIVHTILTKKKQ